MMPAARSALMSEMSHNKYIISGLSERPIGLRQSVEWRPTARHTLGRARLNYIGRQLAVCGQPKVLIGCGRHDMGRANPIKVGGPSL